MIGSGQLSWSFLLTKEAISFILFQPCFIIDIQKTFVNVLKIGCEKLHSSLLNLSLQHCFHVIDRFKGLLWGHQCNYRL